MMSSNVYSAECFVSTPCERKTRSSIQCDHESITSECFGITSPSMATPVSSRVQASEGGAPTLAWVEARIQADGNLPLRRRQELISALRMMGRALKRDLADIPAHPGFIRENLKGFSPAMLNRS